MSPLYGYYCTFCSRVWDEFRKIAERHEERCECGAYANIAIGLKSKPVVYDYYSENLGAYITGPGQRKRLMKKKHMEEAG